uniref:lycopene beta-cyclase n=1 Tax=Chrysotila carterae TaxID=13221 RepID=A0A7S4B0U6_CHRCT
MSSDAEPLNVDVAVIGGGPAGYTMAALLAEKHGHSVVLVDPDPEAAWPNNYGSWLEEWETVSKRMAYPELLSECVAKRWDVTDCFFGGSFGTEFEERTRLDRAYVQVNRAELKRVLKSKLAKASECTVVQASLRARCVAPNVFDANLAHDAGGSDLTLSSGQRVRAKLVVDATGFESKMVARESLAAAGLWKDSTPGYQIAYGFTCDTRGHDPYAAEAMTLFDYRTDHITDAEWQKDAVDRPTFMYAMPQGQNADGSWRIFFEETSLVGRGKRRLEFSELKRRAERRLEHLGIEVVPGSISEKEYCYIPMGGLLPDASQRVIAVGGAAATVHPSTGYQLCRMLTSSTDLAATVSAELARPNFSPDTASAAAYQTLWPRKSRLQRDFQVFGGEFLGMQPVDNLRGFFAAFFMQEMDVWGGFLAGWPGLPGNENHESWYKRLQFGLGIFVRFPPQVAFALMYYAVAFSLEFGPALLRSFASPLFGEDEEETAGVKETRLRRRQVYVDGDLDAKFEVKQMLGEFESSDAVFPKDTAVTEQSELASTVADKAKADDADELETQAPTKVGAS